MKTRTVILTLLATLLWACAPNVPATPEATPTSRPTATAMPEVSVSLPPTPTPDVGAPGPVDCSEAAFFLFGADYTRLLGEQATLGREAVNHAAQNGWEDLDGLRQHLSALWSNVSEMERLQTSPSVVHLHRLWVESGRSTAFAIEAWINHDMASVDANMANVSSYAQQASDEQTRILTLCGWITPTP